MRGTRRIIVVAVGVLLVLIVLSLVLFSLGDEAPDRGRGDPIGLSATR